MKYLLFVKESYMGCEGIGDDYLFWAVDIGKVIFCWMTNMLKDFKPE